MKVIDVGTATVSGMFMTSVLILLRYSIWETDTKGNGVWCETLEGLGGRRTRTSSLTKLNRVLTVNHGWDINNTQQNNKNIIINNQMKEINTILIRSSSSINKDASDNG